MEWPLLRGRDPNQNPVEWHDDKFLTATQRLAFRTGEERIQNEKEMR